MATVSILLAHTVTGLHLQLGDPLKYLVQFVELRVDVTEAEDHRVGTGRVGSSNGTSPSYRDQLPSNSSLPYWNRLFN